MSLHKTPNPEKGARYLGLLDQALCAAHWSEVPELARKVEKHAPERKSFTLAARSQCQIANASHRPTSAASNATSSLHSLGELVPRLLESTTATSAKSYPDDAFVASICLAEIYWVQESPIDALKVLEGATPSGQSEKSAAAPLGWLEVCTVKAAYIRAVCLESTGRHSDARGCYQTAVIQTPGHRSAELRRWTERLLASACMYSVKKMPSPSAQDFSETYTAFKAWAAFWDRAGETNSAGTSNVDVPRRQVWKAYYDLISTILQHGLLYNTTPQANDDLFVIAGPDYSREKYSASKRAQRKEIKEVERTYETLLLKETQFPKASQSNTEVEEWAEQVVTNWRAFSSGEWTDSDLEEGGKNAVSRIVLDILYRAATKTFHSTPILRHLFTIHTALGEFDLAMHAFNSYMEITDKGKAREEKTGRRSIGLDDDDEAVLTVAEAVRVLCRYGDREQAEKALETTGALQKWLDQKRPITADRMLTNGGDHESERPASQSSASALKSTSLAAAYRAMGISQAHWASLTFESSDRPGLLEQAASNLRRAQRYDEDSVETAYSLALVLARQRDVSAAIEVVRSVIESRDRPDIVREDAGSPSPHDRKRKLIPLWHLLALCLTADDEFEAAVQMCQAAFKQFGNPLVLFGQPMEIMLRDPERAIPSDSGARGLVDQMEGFEKEGILQIKMTEIALLELTEGPEAAVDMTDELLSVYSRLFGSPGLPTTSQKSEPAVPTTNSRLGGTLRSIAGSIRPRSSRSVRSEKGTSRRLSLASADNTTFLPPLPAASSNNNTQDLSSPIAITVTNGDNADTEKPRGRHAHHPHLPHLPFHGRKHGDASRSRTRDESLTVSDQDPISSNGNTTLPQSQTADMSNAQQHLGAIPHNEAHTNLPPPPGHDNQPPRQDVRLPAPHPASASTIPEPHLSPYYERRQNIGVLVKTWLFIAELYIRAETYDDAQSAVSNAARFAEALEAGLAGEDGGTSAMKLCLKGWGGGQSIDDLLADVWAAKAQLSLALSKPFAALSHYEQAVSLSPDHPVAIIGLSNLLLDIFEETLPAEEPMPSTRPLLIASNPLIREARPTLPRPTSSSSGPSRRPSLVGTPSFLDQKPRPVIEDDSEEATTTTGRRARPDPTPAELNRLAARDRAYMLLSNLTKLGTGWDDSEAWMAFARACELSGEVKRARQALWWVVELEEKRGVRGWEVVGAGGYTL
ncbi:unnamed protein product [Zymoseptoria tritici ST99CH_1A5]|uniref:Filamentation protein n=1 Tax=Zymoseptoria tritici ST99CH_1A5 TaxID=1276529 RepID=A0A1Y6LSE4_ZYMTR|nr:unnamed protein product [Zymoseptoria tritici ST99CH_1A5]